MIVECGSCHGFQELDDGSECPNCAGAGTVCTNCDSPLDYSKEYIRLWARVAELEAALDHVEKDRVESHAMADEAATVARLLASHVAGLSDCNDGQDVLSEYINRARIGKRPYRKLQWVVLEGPLESEGP